MIKINGLFCFLECATVLSLSYDFDTNPGRDKSPTSCRRHSCQWCCTTTCHLLSPHLYMSYTPFPRTQTGSGRDLPGNFLQLQLCLDKQRHNSDS